MSRYFDIDLEFDRDAVNATIAAAIRNSEAGYVCSVNANVIAAAEKNRRYKEAVNHALVNICDGSLLALLLSILHGRKYKPYVGADLFIEYLGKRRGYRYFFLGSDDKTLNGLKNNLRKLNPAIDEAYFVSLPFRENVADFDYGEIASIINNAGPDIIWVSLGAPKQEQFMHFLQPHLKRGVMFGFGAIFKFYCGDPKTKRAPRLFRSLKLEWAYRVFRQEPGRIRQRILGDMLVILRLIPREIRPKKPAA